MMAVQKIRNEFDPHILKAEFPALHKKPVCFLDSAASAQKPEAVIQAMVNIQQSHYANVHRGVYAYSQESTNFYEAARGKVAAFLNANLDNEIIFTRNTTEAINLFASSWGKANLKADDEIILTELEHHANIVPWHMLRDQTGFTIKTVPVLPNGDIDLDAYQNLLSDKTKLVAFLQMSNALGTILPAAEMTKMAKEYGATVIVDASQSVVHMDVDVQDIGCDFLVFTGHKLYGPTGIGVMWGRENLLNAMPPYQGGGEMIDTVTFDEVTYKLAPARFEAGTPAFVEAVGLGAAIDWVGAQDMGAVRAHEKTLLDAATAEFEKIDGVTIYGTTKNKASILSFTMDGAHPHDVGTIFDQMNVAVRAGHHCAQPLMKAMGVPATVRASFAAYNTLEDVEKLVKAVHKVKKIFG